MKWFIGFLLVFYLLLCGLVYFFQNKLILNPHKTPENHRFRVGTEVEIPLEDNLNMNCLKIQGAPGNDKVVLYFHGNKGNIDRAIYQTRSLQSLGVDVFIPDYRGYGKTEGELKSEKELLGDALKAYDYLKQNYSENNIYVMGYSLGTGMASYVTSKNKPKHLFLVAPFTSLLDMKNRFLGFIPDFLLRYKLENAKYIKEITCPISIVHGTNDNIVDYQYSEILKKDNSEKVNFITSEGQSHRAIIFDPLLQRELSRVLN